MSDSIQPITPNEIIEDLGNIIHPSVITAVNEILRNKYRGNSVNIKQDTIVENALHLGGLSRETIFEDHHLDFEKLYKSYGWEVTHDKPGYSESYAASFTFKPIKK